MKNQYIYFWGNPFTRTALRVDGYNEYGLLVEW